MGEVTAPPRHPIQTHKLAQGRAHFHESASHLMLQMHPFLGKVGKVTLLNRLTHADVLDLGNARFIPNRMRHN